nr:MAG TPA: hypothetical protein [Bacteriophage sp.]
MVSIYHICIRYLSYSSTIYNSFTISYIRVTIM